jgi:hypothetical protein
MRNPVLFLPALVLFCLPALAGDATDGFTIESTPGLTTAGLIIQLSGDDNGDAEATVLFRPAGGSWRTAHPGVRISGGRLATTLFRLAEGTGYEVSVTVTDPDGAPAPQSESFTSRTVPALPGSGTGYFVDPSGDDGWPGTQAQPFATIGHALSVAGAGDTINVGDGVYREALTLNGLSAAADPLWIRSLNPGGAVLDGADQALWENPGGDLWQDDGDGIFSTPVAADVGYVASDGGQLYHYDSLADLQSASVGVHEGYFWDGSRLHVRLADDSDPDGHQLAAGVREAAFSILNSAGIVIQGFEIRHYGAGDYPKGIYLRSSSDCVVRGNTIHHTMRPVWIRPTDAHRNLVEGNHCWETGVVDWPWDAVKGSFHETSGISINGGTGNVVRDNDIDGLFNGIFVGSFSNDWDESESPHTDVHGNRLTRINDDPLEPEGACLQVRFFDNVSEESLMGISLAPINVGPVWIHHNSFWRTRSSGLKLNNSPVGPMLIYHNTFFTDLPSTNCVTTGESGWSNTVLRNNILHGTRYVFEDTHTPGPGHDWDHDLLFSTAQPASFVKWNNTRYYTLAEFQAGTGQEPNGLSADPLFTDPAGADLTLAAGSPAIDAGVSIRGINDGHNGSAPDLGAFESGPGGTISAAISCLPSAGTVPFQSTFTVTMTNRLKAEHRRAAGRIDLRLGNGQQYGGWRSGYTNLSPAEQFTSQWTQAIPALGPVIGQNVFALHASDVTPPPWNQGPRPV